jgi:hypothetical protein
MAGDPEDAQPAIFTEDELKSCFTEDELNAINNPSEEEQKAFDEQFERFLERKNSRSNASQETLLAGAKRPGAVLSWSWQEKDAIIKDWLRQQRSRKKNKTDRPQERGKARRQKLIKEQIWGSLSEALRQKPTSGATLERIQDVLINEYGIRAKRQEIKRDVQDLKRARGG